MKISKQWKGKTSLARQKSEIIDSNDPRSNQFGVTKAVNKLEWARDRERNQQHSITLLKKDIMNKLSIEGDLLVECKQKRTAWANQHRWRCCQLLKNDIKVDFKERLLFFFYWNFQFWVELLSNSFLISEKRRRRERRLMTTKCIQIKFEFSRIPSSSRLLFYAREARRKRRSERETLCVFPREGKVGDDKH